jgi:hypothetical protein
VAGGPPFVRDGDRFAVDLPEDLRELLASMVGDLRTLVTTEDPSSDPSVARLYPPAYPDDLLQNLDYDRSQHDDLHDGRLGGIDTVLRTLGATSLTEEELLAWLRTCNDLRLVLGTRLDIQEDSTAEDFAHDREATTSFSAYVLLTEIVGEIVEALDPG